MVIPDCRLIVSVLKLILKIFRLLKKVKILDVAKNKSS